MSESGAVLFARYAYAPNELGFCGPAEAATLFDLGVSGQLGAAGPSHADIESIASRFSGAWPYAVLLAELAGVADPLDEQVMRAYWTGGALLERIDREAFGVKLLEVFGSQAGHYWTHLTSELLGEVAPTHDFHVFGVYPWTRLLAGGPADQPLHVLDNCRIGYGQVSSVEGEHVIVRTRRLTWDGCQLGLGPAGQRRVRFADGDGRSFVRNPVAGEWLALHWDSACERLTADQLRRLRRCTAWQLRMTNRRLARERTGSP